jgi:hypothetical protein
MSAIDVIKTVGTSISVVSWHSSQATAVGVAPSAVEIQRRLGDILRDVLR